MDEPKVGGTSPVVGEFKAGDYWWCSCGLSNKQPFCDGSHSGTGFSPRKITLEADCKFAWCTCKKSQKGHQCDGAHKCLPK
jgi:CDGSH-type Zn-finger protein